MPFTRQPHDRRSFGHGRGPQAHARGSRTTTFVPRPPIVAQGPVTPVIPPRRKPLPEGLIEKLCYEKEVLKPKPDCRAALIDFCILEDDFDIDEAEDAVDKALRERNLWNEPSLEDILREDDEDSAPSPDPQIPPLGNISA